VYTCIFGSKKQPTDLVAGRCQDAAVSTDVISVAYQIVSCKHPPADIAATLYGCPVTVQVDYNRQTERMSSQALYREIVEVPAKPKYRYCACLLVWYRAEFLHEWLWYHTKAHGLQKTWVYDNDSAEDDLPEMTSLLAEEFNIEYVPWHTHQVQAAYHGHCATLAGRECEWVSFTDVDEFVHVDPSKSNGRLDQLLHELELQGESAHLNRVGGLQAKMITVSTGDATMLRQPEGGVLRNYRCVSMVRNTNWKSIVRPRALHFSLTNGVHEYAYDSPTYEMKPYVGSTAMVRFYHYQYQAWEIHMRKYIRRASAVSRSFKLQNKSEELSWMRPDIKWKEAVSSKCITSSTMHGTCQ
jgi:hypothetical protein